MPWTKCPEAKMNWGIGAGCCDPIRGLGGCIVGAVGGCWVFSGAVIMVGGDSVKPLGWVLLGVVAGTNLSLNFV